MKLYPGGSGMVSVPICASLLQGIFQLFRYFYFYFYPIRVSSSFPASLHLRHKIAISLATTGWAVRCVIAVDTL